jgi:hypothetical protein
VDLNPETALLGVYPRINRIFTNPNRQLHSFKNQFLCVYSCEFVLFVDRLQRMTVKELRTKFADVCGDETRSGNRAWLIKRIGWRMQANYEGGLTERAPPGTLGNCPVTLTQMNAAQAPHPSTTCAEPRYWLTQRKPHRVLTLKPVKLRVTNPAFPRRSFLQTSTFAAAAAACGCVSRSVFAAEKTASKVRIQLYSLH